MLHHIFDTNVLIWAVLGLAIILVVRYMTASSGATEKSRYVSQKKPVKVFVKPVLPKDYTPAEVAAHNTQDDCWIIVDDKVYDVTTYIAEHPGELSILNNAGKDSSVGFHGDQHGESVYALVEEYRIGNLIK